jgi:nucleotide-binding universal stress UspA family protein
MAAKPIVVGTDGSEKSLRAVEWAAQEATLREVALRIVSIIPPTGWFAPPGSQSEPQRKAAGNALADAVDAVHLVAHWLTVDTSLRSGEPGPELATLGQHAEMLVVGSPGPGGSAMTQGPVGRYLVAHAPGVVVVVPGEAGPPRHQIAVGVRDAADSEAPLAFAFDEASHRGAHLLAVQAWHYVPPPGTGPRLATPPQVSADALTRLFQLLEPWQEKYPDVTVGEEIIHAHPGHALAKLSAAADLLVLGRHRGSHTITDAHIGPVTHSVLSRAQCPIAIVPAG